MNDYPEMKCSKCSGIIEHDDTYDSYANDDYIVDLCIEHCTICDSIYQWKKEYEMNFNGIADFEEVT